jgi:hypothetical protein
MKEEMERIWRERPCRSPNKLARWCPAESSDQLAGFAGSPSPAVGAIDRRQLAAHKRWIARLRRAQ